MDTNPNVDEHSQLFSLDVSCSRTREPRWMTFRVSIDTQSRESVDGAYARRRTTSRATNVDANARARAHRRRDRDVR